MRVFTEHLLCASCPAKGHMGVHYPTESTQPSQEVSITLPILQASNVEAQRDEVTYPKSRSWERQGLG